MTATMDRTQTIEDLRRAIEELTEPDLHLPRAEILRSSVIRLLQNLREPGVASEDRELQASGFARAK